MGGISGNQEARYASRTLPRLSGRISRGRRRGGIGLIRLPAVINPVSKEAFALIRLLPFAGTLPSVMGTGPQPREQDDEEQAQEEGDRELVVPGIHFIAPGSTGASR
jgi:hypothetical protein